MRFVDIPLREKINENGFRRWYEYELVRSFGYLGLGLLVLLAGLISIEGVFDFSRFADRWIQLLGAFAAISFAGWAWYQFVRILLNAEYVSEQAICPGCQRYGLLKAIQDYPSAQPDQRILSVQCNKCDRVWRLAYALESRHADS